MKRNRTRIKWCIVCGKRIPECSPRLKVCSKHCALRRKNLSRHGLSAPYEYVTEPPIQSFTLAEINAEARAPRLTYGQYVAQLAAGKIKREISYE